ncbi:MAG: DUF1579 family protein [Fimbriimonadaceae bacterium]|nr:DUF1579 family protein [Fimbriimonadaceae bacterium]
MRTYLIILVIALLAPLVVSQQPQQPPVHPKMKELEFLLGAWKGDLKYEIGEASFSGPVIFKFEKVLDGTYVQVTVENDLKTQGVVKGIGMLAFDGKKQKFAMFTFANGGMDGAAPREETGAVEGSKLSLETGANSVIGQLRQSWERKGDEISYVLEMRQGDKYLPIATATVKLAKS